MALIAHSPPAPRLDRALVDAFRSLPTGVISDEMNRAGAMVAAIKPVAAGMQFAGEAMTVQVMTGDNGALHHAIAMAWAGAVLVVDARGHADTAVWGEIMATAAAHRGIAAVVVDGAVRDVTALRKAPICTFARAVVPAGPHKGWGGIINGHIQCGGCPVAPGDLVAGDDDGVVVVPRAAAERILAGARTRQARETAMLEAIARGETTVALLGLPPIDTAT